MSAAAKLHHSAEERLLVKAPELYPRRTMEETQRLFHELPLRLLLIEDSEDDALLLVRELRKGGFDPDFVRIDSPQELEVALDGSSWDAVIADYNMPVFTGLDALRIIQAKGLDLPFILVSGVIGEEKAVEAMKAGAHDFIMKGNYSRLAPALERELRDAEVRRERRQSMEELHRAHGELENRVRQRTAELTQANEALLAEMSERKRTEDELRASEEKFSTMLQTVPIAIALATSPDGVLYNVNPAWLDLTGITRKEDAIGKTSLELGLNADAAQRQSILNEFQLNGFARNVEHTFCTRRGVQRTVLVNLDRVEIGGRTFILSTMEEITERKQAEEALQQKQAELLEAQSIAKIGSWRWDAHTDATTGSDELLRIYGFDPATQEMPDFRKQRGLCYPVADWERINAAVLDTLKTGVGYELDVMAFRAGTPIWVTTRSEAVLDAEGRIVGLRGTVQDVTERKRAVEELLENHRKLESMAIELSLAEERERDRIAGELHDQVGQRLIFGKMKLGALAGQVHTDEGINDVEELDRIIDLSLQDIRSLTFQLRPPLLASAGLEAALNWLGEEFHEQYGLLLTYSDDGQQKPMRYEARSTVFQAAREMLLNTVKHADAKEIGIAIRREADMLRVCLSDNGRGFDVAEAGRKKSRSGGFGLINVRRRIEHLGGSIIIESRPGNGTRVTIMVPLDISQ